MIASDEWERRYYAPRYQARLSCEERARLIAFGVRYEARRDEWMDCYVSAKRIAFVRHLIARGKLSEGIEEGGPS